MLTNLCQLSSQHPLHNTLPHPLEPSSSPFVSPSPTASRFPSSSLNFLHRPAPVPLMLSKANPKAVRFGDEVGKGSDVGGRVGVGMGVGEYVKYGVGGWEGGGAVHVREQTGQTGEVHLQINNKNDSKKVRSISTYRGHKITNSGLVLIAR